MSKVKVLYVRNLVADVTEDEIRELFSKTLERIGGGAIERVKKLKDYAFVHFEDREQAVKCMEALDAEAAELRGVRISISLAKPPSDRKKKEEMLRQREKRVNQMMAQRVPAM